MTGDDTVDALLVAPAVREAAVPVTAGFVALVDCAPLVVAREKGFAAREGLDLTLVREPSWANIRDRVGLGHFDVAHMLAPMAIAGTLRLGALDAPLIAPFVLDQGGNAIAVSLAVHRAMAAGGDPGTIVDPASTGRALARVVADRRQAGQSPLCLAMTHPFSSHNYELRYWLAAAGIDPDHDIRLIVVPPPQMVDAIAAGHIDGFCAGAPWPAVLVAASLGHLVATTAALKPASPKKVLGMRKAWAERYPDRLDRLVRTVQAACDWCDDPANIDELAALLGRPDHVDVPADVIESALRGRIIADPGGVAVVVPDYIRFADGQSNRPRTADALWYASQMARWGQVPSLQVALQAARDTVRADLYDRAFGTSVPDAAGQPDVMLFDGIAFDPQAPDAYLGQLPRFG